jgi:polar amino acid transport system substrate-binding protein
MGLRRYRIAVAAVIVLLVVPACANKQPSPAAGGSQSPNATAGPSPAFVTLKSGVLTVGSCLDYAPFEYYQGQQLKGFDVELVDAIASKLGLKVQWVKSNFDTIFTALDADKFDLVAAASSITTKRLQVVNFTDPYYDSLIGLTVNVTKTPGIKSVNDLKPGDVVGAQKGTTNLDYAINNLQPKGIGVKTFTAAPDAYTDLEAGNIQAVVDDAPAAQAQLAARPGLQIVQDIQTGEQYGMAVPKDNTDLLAAVNQALSAVINDGTYATIFSKYFPGLQMPAAYQPS